MNATLLHSELQETGHNGPELQLTMEDHMCTHSSPHTKLCLHFFTKQVTSCAGNCEGESHSLSLALSPAAHTGAAACGGVCRPTLLLVGRRGAGGAACPPLHPPQWAGAACLPQEPVHWLLPAAAADSVREAWPAGEGGARGGPQSGQCGQHCCHQRGHPVLRAVLSNNYLLAGSPHHSSHHTLITVHDVIIIIAILNVCLVAIIIIHANNCGKLK